VGSSKTGLCRIRGIAHNWQSDANIEWVSSNVRSFSLHMVSSVSKAGMQYAVLNGHNGQSEGWSNMTCMTYGPLNTGRERVFSTGRTFSLDMVSSVGNQGKMGYALNRQ
jgi:hypothetical protein